MGVQDEMVEAVVVVGRKRKRRGGGGGTSAAPPTAYHDSWSFIAVAPLLSPSTALFVGTGEVFLARRTGAVRGARIL